MPHNNEIRRVLRLHFSSQCKTINLVKNCSIAILLICMILMMSCSKKQMMSPAFNGLNKGNSLKSSRYETIYKYAQLFPNYTQISVGIFSDSNVEYFGVIRYNDSIYEIQNRDEIFEIGSIAKIFNGTILAKYVEQQKISLNANISEFLPVKIKGNPGISILQLANHSSGLERNPSDIKSDCPTKPYPENIYTDSMLLNYFAKNVKLQSVPGLKWSYSNTGSQLLGYILSKVEGDCYETMLQKEIFQKYGMTNSTTNKIKIMALPVFKWVTSPAPYQGHLGESRLNF